MTQINYKKVSTNPELFKAFNNFFKKYFNTKITTEEYLTFVEKCECDYSFHLNPISMCAWKYNKTVDFIFNKLLKIEKR